MRCTLSLIFVTISRGVPLGANSPNHTTAVNPGKVSATVGNSAIAGYRRAALCPAGLSLPAFHGCTIIPVLTNIIGMCPATTSVSAGAAPL